jgi:hypothetical protein
MPVWKRQSWADAATSLQCTKQYFSRARSVGNTRMGIVSCPFRRPELGRRSGRLRPPPILASIAQASGCRRKRPSASAFGLGLVQASSPKRRRSGTGALQCWPSVTSTRAMPARRGRQRTSKEEEDPSGMTVGGREGGGPQQGRQPTGEGGL